MRISVLGILVKLNSQEGLALGSVFLLHVQEQIRENRELKLILNCPVYLNVRLLLDRDFLNK
jgi:hypothetical protein